LSVLLLPLSALLIMYSHEILLIWLNDPMIADNSYIIMSLIVFGTMLNGLPSVPGNCSIGFGWPMLVTYVNLSQLAVIIPVLFWLVSLYKGVGAALTWVLLNSAYISVLTHIFFKHYLTTERIKWYVHDISVPALSAFLVVSVSRFIVPAFDDSLSMFVWIALTGIVAFSITALTLPHVRKIITKQLYHIKIKNNEKNNS
jgi:O-antigen/teichoic acid export membrane protein